VDGVAVQAAHNLGAPRRRLPSHVSKEAPSISPPLSLPRRIPYGEVALSRFAFATHRVLGWVASMPRLFTGAKRHCVGGGSTIAARDTRCCNSVRVERRACILVDFLFYSPLSFFFLKADVFGWKFSESVRRESGF
jgi:hypothetical protein